MNVQNQRRSITGMAAHNWLDALFVIAVHVAHLKASAIAASETGDMIDGTTEAKARNDPVIFIISAVRTCDVFKEAEILSEPKCWAT